MSETQHEAMRKTALRAAGQPREGSGDRALATQLRPLLGRIPLQRLAAGASPPVPPPPMRASEVERPGLKSIADYWYWRARKRSSSR